MSLSHELVILDDIFPHSLSAFRIAEYNAYLEAFPTTRVYSTASVFSLIGEKRDLAAVIEEYEGIYPHLQHRVFPYPPEINWNGKLIYSVFLNNIFSSLDLVEKYHVPFMFTLYPGGGFRLNEYESDTKLQQVCQSPYFQKVIVTQQVTYDYLIQKKFCTADQIQLIYGVVLPIDRLQQQPFPKQQWGVDKVTFDLCFVAHKYTEQGFDKGFDTFIKVALLLSQKQPIHFHVVGNFSLQDIDKMDVDISELDGKLHFYGQRTTDFFPEFYAGMDIILSPNRAFVLAPGAFDGFPTGACVEAGLCGVGMFCRDPLNLNIALKEQEEVVILPEADEAIATLILSYYRHPTALYQLAQNGRAALSQIFSLENQIQPRIKLISQVDQRDYTSQVRPQLEQFNWTIQSLKAQLKLSQQELKLQRKQTRQKEKQLQQCQKKVTQLQSMIQDMERSKFWRLRNIWLQIKHRMRNRD
jgi:hypothetical protein